VLLLDEPLGALDLKLRRQMQLELKRIQMDVGITFIHVTHDQEEAMTMADTIAVMNQGHVEQLGEPAQLYENPVSVFVANFLGQSNLLRGTASGSESGWIRASTPAGVLRIPKERSSASGSDVLVGVRPEKLHVHESADAGAVVPGSHNSVTGRIVDASFIGVSTQYLVDIAGGQQLTVFSQNTGTSLLRPGTDVVLHWDAAHTFALDGAEDVRSGLDDSEAE